MKPMPLTWSGRPDWNRIFAPFGFNPPSSAFFHLPNMVRYIYFIQSGDLVKVGVSSDPKARLKSFRAGAPNGLMLRGTIEVPGILAFQTEKRIHAELKHVAVGREWFRISPREARSVAKPICARAKAAASRFWECHDAFEEMRADGLIAQEAA